MGFTQRAEKTLQLVILVVKLSKNHREKIRDIQESRGFTRQRRTRIHILDAKKNFTFVVSKGKLKVKTMFQGDADIEVVIERLCTLKHLRKGKKPGMHPSGNQTIDMPYSPLDAWKYGDVRTYGDSSTNDLITFLDIFTEIITLIPENEVDKLIGKCAHDG